MFYVYTYFKKRYSSSFGGIPAISNLFLPFLNNRLGEWNFILTIWVSAVLSFKVRSYEKYSNVLHNHLFFCQPKNSLNNKYHKGYSMEGFKNAISTVITEFDNLHSYTFKLKIRLHFSLVKNDYTIYFQTFELEHLFF